MSDVTRILSAIEDGDQHAAERLLPLIYDELRRLAAHKMAGESPDHTLQATALVHEAYIRLVDGDKAQHWDGRGHFFAAAAEAMRRILLENARRKGRLKHGGEHHRVDLDKVLLSLASPPEDLLALDEILTDLDASDHQSAELVKLRCFAGLSVEQAAEVMGISTRTAYRDWSYARAWLFRRFSGDTE